MLENVKFINRYMLTYCQLEHSSNYLEKESLKLFNLYQFCIPMRMEDYQVHYRHLMVFFLKKKEKKKRKQRQKCLASNKICAVYSECALADRAVWKWFAKFRVGDCSLINEECSDSPLPQTR